MWYKLLVGLATALHVSTAQECEYRGTNFAPLNTVRWDARSRKTSPKIGPV
jgi:hypothetical protein